MKNKIYKIFYVLAIISAALFVIFTAIDSFKYDSTLNSAPFYVFAFVRCIEFIIPAAVFAVVGFILNRRSKNK